MGNRIKLKIKGTTIASLEKERLFYSIANTYYSPFTSLKGRTLVLNRGRAGLSIAIEELPMIKRTYKVGGVLKYFYRNSNLLGELQSIALALTLYPELKDLPDGDLLKLVVKVYNKHSTEYTEFIHLNTTKKFKSKWKRAPWLFMQQEFLNRGYRSKHSDHRYKEKSAYLGYKKFAFPVPLPKKQETIKLLINEVGIKNKTSVKWN